MFQGDSSYCAETRTRVSRISFSLLTLSVSGMFSRPSPLSTDLAFSPQSSDAWLHVSDE